MTYYLKNPKHLHKINNFINTNNHIKNIIKQANKKVDIANIIFLQREFLQNICKFKSYQNNILTIEVLSSYDLRQLQIEEYKWFIDLKKNALFVDLKQIKFVMKN